MTLRVTLPLDHLTIRSLTDLIPGAAFYEREAAEMMHVIFEGHPDPRPLLLPDDWAGEAPLRQTACASSPVAMAGSPLPVCETADGRMVIPIGPQHPALKEPLSFMLTVEGERIMESVLRLGYVHRGIERLCQQRTYIQNVHLIERVCGICSQVHSTVYCQGVEALLGIEAPPRARYLRSLLCELERVHSHLLWLGVLSESIGFTTVFMYAWRDREIALDIMEDLSGGRVSHALNTIGGVRQGITAAQARSASAKLSELHAQVERLLGVIEHESTFRARTQNVGHLSAEQVRRYCVVGPMARASGVGGDVRREVPYAAYDELAPQTFRDYDGDVWARTRVRLWETLESIRLCQAALSSLPEGELIAKAPRRVPAGEVVMRAEAPRGEVLYYIRSDGSDRPARLKIRTPSLTSLITLREQMLGANVADIPAILGGMDLCISCADR